MIRQRVMCQPDVGIRGLEWDGDQMWASASNDIDRECVDWSVLEKWTKKRVFLAEEKLVTRPGGELYSFNLCRTSGLCVIANGLA